MISIHRFLALGWQYSPYFTRFTITVIIGAVVGNMVYNRYFHPLRHFPGPFWASVSDFWKLYICMTKESHTRGIKLHEIYGPVVRVAPNLLVFNDPKLLPVVYHRQVDKTDFYSTGILGDIAPPFQTMAHKEHAVKRKRIAVSSDVDKAILQFESIMKEKFAKPSKRLDFAEWVKWFVYDSVSHMAFGEAIGFVREGRDVGGLIKAFHDMAPLAGLVATLPWLMNPLLQNPLLGRFFMPKAGDGTGTGRIMSYRDKMLKKRFENRHSDHHSDFLHNLLTATNDDGTLMSIEEIKTESFVLMVAATDTSSAFISPFVNNIIQDKEIYAKLIREIRSFELAGKLSRPVATFQETNEMKYFMACIKETLRFSPSIPFILPRYVSKGGMNINGIWVPEGTELGANPYIIQRDAGTFGADAHIFRPERWLENEERTKEMDKYILTWGYGTRICLGKNIAQMITQKLCLQLFRTFRFRSVNPEKPWHYENLAIMIYWDQWVFIEELLQKPELDDAKTEEASPQH